MTNCAAAPTLHPVNVLLVDDKPAKLLTYEAMLSGLGERLLRATSADEALRILLKNDVALILTDVSMPTLDGFGFAKLLREHPRFATTAIIFISASALSDIDRLQGYASGAVDYVTVPVAPELLRAKVKVFVELYRKQQELERLRAELEGRIAERTAELEAFSARLAESEERLRLAQEAGGIGLWDWNLASGEVYWSPNLRSLLGVPHDMQPTSQSLLDLVHPDDADAARTAADAAMRGDHGLDQEFRIVRPDGREVWIASRGEVMTSADGARHRLIGVNYDISTRKQSQQALAESEERYRALVDNANDIVATLDLDFRFTSVNPAVERVLGYTPQEVEGSPLSRFVPEDQLAKHTAMLREKLAGGGSTQYEMQLFGKDREKRFTLEVNSKLMYDADGKPTGIHAIARDVSGRKDAEARQLLLVRELQHRTKNMLAVIQSIATSTLTRSKDLDGALETFLGRLHALAHAQEFVAAGPGGGVPLRDLVEAELSTFAARSIIEGEELVVGGSFAQIFALVVHELATNAVKYGALSAQRGRVAIHWKIDGSGGEPHLHFSWMERGGPPAQPPKDSGLGTQLLSSLGKPQIAFKEEGFEYVLAVPLAEATRGTE
jgi:PAS domain S-box-containing protein